jgi:hypothetical protein
MHQIMTIRLILLIRQVLKNVPKNRENVEQMEEPGKGMQPAMANK